MSSRRRITIPDGAFIQLVSGNECRLKPKGVKGIALNPNETKEITMPPSYLNLLEAVVKGDIARARKLLQNGTFTHPPILDIVPQAGGSIITSCPPTPLHFAAADGYQELVELLIRHKAKVNAVATTANMATPLMFAAQNGRTAAVRALLAAGADANLRNIQNNTAFWIAACKGHKDCVGELMLHGGYPAGEISKVLDIAIQSNHAPVVELLLRLGAALEVNGDWSPLARAVYNGNAEVVSLLLKHGASANPPVPGPSPLMRAIEESHAEITSVLILSGADLDRETSGAASPRVLLTHVDHPLESSILSCGACGAEGLPLKRCSVCNAVAYCGQECQRDHWKTGGHKRHCEALKVQSAKQSLAEMLREPLPFSVQQEECLLRFLKQIL